MVVRSVSSYSALGMNTPRKRCTTSVKILAASPVRFTKRPVGIMAKWSLTLLLSNTRLLGRMRPSLRMPAAAEANSGMASRTAATVRVAMVM